MTVPMPGDTLDIALELLNAHPTWYIFPIRRLEKTPPLFRDELLTNNSNDPAIIRKWHAKYLGCNWGIALKKSGLVVVDVDTKPGKRGQQTLDTLELLYGPLPETLTVRTPSGGLHYYFEEANGVTHRMAVSGFGDDVDSTNYVLVPGCWLSSGGSYQIINPAAVAPTPAWFGEYLKAPDPTEARTVEQVAKIELDTPTNVSWAIHYLQNDAPPSIMFSNGNTTLLTVAGMLKDHGISESRAVELLDEHYNVPGKCEPQWNVGEGPAADRLDVVVHNAYSYMRKNAPGEHTAEAEFEGPVEKETLAWVKAQAARDQKVYDKKHAGHLFVGDEPPKPGEILRGDRPRPPLVPLSEIDESVPPKNTSDICNRWVWCTGLKRFINRKDPLKQWDTKQFDSEFNPFVGKGSSMSGALFKTNRIQRFHYLAFRPSCEEFVGTEYNIWRPGDVQPKEGDTTIWNEHINYLFQNPEDRDHVLNWLAWVLQNPGRKPNHALLIVGRNTGTGKSLVARIMEQLVGTRNTQRPKNSSMGGDFNSWLKDCRLCIVEEMMQVNRRENINALRDLITESRVEVNIKGIPAFMIDNYVAMMGVSNHPDALPLDDKDRRWLVVETNAPRRDVEYYKPLWDLLPSKEGEPPKNAEGLAAIYHELLHRNLGSYTALASAPDTEAKTRMIEMSRSDPETWLLDNIGNPPLSNNIVALRDIIEQMPANAQRTPRLASAIIPNFLRDKLKGESVGQVRLSDGKKIALWVLHGRRGMIPPNDIAGIYEGQIKLEIKSAAEQAADDFGEGQPSD